MKYCWPCRKKRIAEWNSENRHRTRAYVRSCKYGISLEEAFERGRLTNCEICGSDNGGRALHLDHNHKTGAVRGMICQPCNTFVGFVERRGHVLNDLFGYLEKYNGASDR
jgi:hypothetical protein